MLHSMINCTAERTGLAVKYVTSFSSATEPETGEGKDFYVIKKV